jgi:hypothetical protein
MAKKAFVPIVAIVVGIIAAGLAKWFRTPGATGALSTSKGAIDGSNESGARAPGLVNQLERHPAVPSKNQERLGLFLLDVERGRATLIADEPAAGLTHCGSARWTHDGQRVLFDATPGNTWNQTHLFAIDAGESRAKITDLGPGNCPSPSSDGHEIAFVLNSVAVPGAKPGVWVMKADGSERRHLGSFGRPFWSPDNRQLLIVGFSDPCELSLMDVQTRETRPVSLPGEAIHSIPSWVDRNTLVAVIGTGEGRAIALIDIADPEHAKVKEVLRDKDARPTVAPAYPVYSELAHRCVFVNANPKGMSVYSIQHEKNARARRVEPDGFDQVVSELALSPDGRHMVFCSDRRVRNSP